MKKRLLALSLALLFLLAGCVESGLSHSPSPSQSPDTGTAGPSPSPSPAPSPATDLSEEKIAPYCGLFGYSIQAADPETGSPGQFSGCLYVSNTSVDSLGVMELGDLNLAPGADTAEYLASSWQDVLEDDAITYTNWDGAEVTLTWSTNRNAIHFTLKKTQSGETVRGSANRVSAPEGQPLPIEHHLPQYEIPETAAIRPLMGTYCYVGYYNGFEDMYLDRYGYLTITQGEDGLMKIDGNGPLAIHRSGLLWQGAAEDGYISFYGSGSCDLTVELEWSEDRSTVTIMTYDLTSGGVMFLAVAARAV